VLALFVCFCFNGAAECTEKSSSFPFPFIYVEQANQALPTISGLILVMCAVRII